jgi:GLPGLI family protein
MKEDMNKWFIKIIFLFLLTNAIHAQEVIFEYSQYQFRKANKVKLNFIQYKSENKSISKVKDINDATQLENYQNFEITKKTDSIVCFVEKDVDYYGFTTLPLCQIYKDYDKNELFLSEPNFLDYKHKIIKDSVTLFNWEILDIKDTLIMNLNCKKAKTNFRGRDYIAYFSPDIANNGGPWKFDGLPGFIIKINSTDGYLNIEPLAIKINTNTTLKIENPYANKKVVNFSDLKNTIIKEEREHFKRIKSKNQYFMGYTVPAGWHMIEDIGLNYERKYE